MGVTDTRAQLRLGRANAYIVRRLLFGRNLERKPVRNGLFRLVWPMLTQRRLVLPLLRPKGITWFPSRALVVRLARLVGDRTCLEIAAGDGALSRFLAAEGVRISTTGREPVAASCDHSPQVVICSWPPAGNTFERQVFRTGSVELYIVVSTRDEAAAGDWDAYRDQADFVRVEDVALNRLVLPPELDPAVLIFHRVGEQ